MRALRAAAWAMVVAAIAVPAFAGQGDGGRPLAEPERAAADQAKGAQPPPKTKPQPQPAKPQRPKPAPLTPAQLARRAPGRPGSFEVLAGAAYLGAGSIGSSVANLTANGSTTPYQYFVATGNLGAAPAFDARLTYNLSRRIAVEGGIDYSAPTVSVTIGSDVEAGATSATPSEKLSQYFIDASVLVFLPKLAFSRGRGRMFVEGGVGYLRQLHEGNFSVEAGQVYNAGAGVKYFFKPRPRGFIKGFGVRADVRGYYKNGGYSFDGSKTWTVGLAGGAVIAF